MENHHQLHQQLQELAQTVQGHDPVTAALPRRRALERLLRLLYEHRHLYKPSINKVPPSLRDAYPEICDEAQSLLLSLVHKEIDKYDPNRATVLNWVRFHINRRCISEAMRNIEDPLFSKSSKQPDDQGRKYRWQRNLAPIDGRHADDGRETLPDGQDLPPSTVEQIRSVLEADPRGKFKAAHVRGNPEANFQVIALGRCDNTAWEELATQLGEKTPTLSSFYQRKLNKFAPEIRQYIQDNNL